MITTLTGYPFCLNRPHRAAVVWGYFGLLLSAWQSADGDFYCKPEVLSIRVRMNGAFGVHG